MKTNYKDDKGNVYELAESEGSQLIYSCSGCAFADDENACFHAPMCLDMNTKIQRIWVEVE